jgi:addiction module HigA family antidote
MEKMHDPAHPGEILREELEARGTSITAAARALGVTRKALSDVVNLKAGVSPVMARRLEAALDTPARLWINLQAAFDLSQAEAIELGDIQPIRAAAGR